MAFFNKARAKFDYYADGKFFHTAPVKKEEEKEVPKVYVQVILFA